jgi:hypothetical protein
MRRILLSSIAAGFALSSFGAMAQTAAPVPNASGSQATNPAGTGSTPSVMPMTGGAAGTVAPVPNASGSQVTNPAGTGATTK